MRVIITRFLTLSAQNISDEVVWALAFIYFLLVLVTLASVWSSPSGVVQKIIWTMLVLTLPVAGMALYCVRCLFRADYSWLTQMGILSGARKFQRRHPSVSNA